MDCQFCHEHYRFDRNDIDHLFFWPHATLGLVINSPGSQQS
jgi:hypothetical protein